MITKIIATILIGIGSMFGVTQNKDSKLTLGAFSDPFLSVQLASSPVNNYCLKTDGTNNSWSSSCGSGGGGSAGGTWSTTTSQVGGQFVNYSNNNTDIVAIGSNSSSTAAFWFDPNTTTGYVSGKLGIGTSTASSRLTIHANNGDTNTLLLSVGSSTQSATTTLMTLDNKGYLGLGTTTPFGQLSVNPNGITGPSFVIGSSTATNLIVKNDGSTGIGTSTPRALLDLHRTTSFDPSLSVNGGFGGTDIARFYRDASSGMGVAILAPGSIPQISYRVGMSSLGAGTSRNSLLVDSAGATFRISTSTTNSVNDIEPFIIKNSNSFVGIASSSPYGQFSINPLVYNSGAPSFVIGSSTATRLIVNGSGYVGIGTSTPKGQLNVSAGSSLYTSLAPLFVENNGSAAASYVAQFSAGSATGNSYPSFNLTNSGSTILNSQSSFLYYGINNAPGSGGGLSKGQLFITNGNSSTNWFNIFVDSSTNANLSSNGPIRIFKTLGGSSDIFNIASSTGGLASSTYMTVNAYGSVGIGTSTMFSRNKLTISNPDSTTELSLTNGTLTSPQWAFNVLQNGDLAIATSSPVTGATSTLTSAIFSATGRAGLAIGSTTGPTAGPFATLAVNPEAGAFSNQFVVGSSTATNFRIDNSGYVYAPNTLSSGSAQTGYWCYDTSGQFIRTSTACIVSSEKFKTKISNLNEGIKELLKLRPVSYYKKDPLDKADSYEQIGFIAEEVEKIDNRLIAYDNSGNVRGFRYDQFTALITKSIQDIWNKITKHDERISKLEIENKMLIERINKLEKKINEK